MESGWKVVGSPAAAARGRGAEGGAAVLEPQPPPPVAVGPRGGPQSPVPQVFCELYAVGCGLSP